MTWHSASPLDPQISADKDRFWLQLLYKQVKISTGRRRRSAIVARRLVTFLSCSLKRTRNATIIVKCPVLNVKEKKITIRCTIKHAIKPSMLFCLFITSLFFIHLCAVFLTNKVAYIIKTPAAYPIRG